ncbi:hypothetical protein SAMN05216249_10997 [Acetitomaculum ruminis DSM 5522]|uniref:Uncharacterized protein n=1 Tax=Acetitomaculum ruminis DSM 5522 TaxID=1120918 RepID=A0A1I0YFF8_9FIRM|nr:hypothetical protein [Acetitomaculum ruminis]SFB10923.1 hypothetical protein SAMN05216249_10997 [Acetitomaculum ruminis DSM 5522]
MAGIKDKLSDALQKTGISVEAVAQNNERAKLNRMKEVLGGKITEINKQQADFAEKLNAKDKRMEELLNELSDYIEKLSLVMVNYDQKIKSYNDNYMALERKLDQVNGSIGGINLNGGPTVAVDEILDETKKAITELREDIRILQRSDEEQFTTLLEKTDARLDEFSNKLLAISSMSDSKSEKEKDEIVEKIDSLRAEILDMREASKLIPLNEINEQLTSIDDFGKKLDDLQEEIKEAVHIESAKGYRSIEDLITLSQTAQREEKEEEEETLEELMYSVKRMQTANLVFSVINFLGFAAIIGFIIYEVFKPTLF